MRTRIVWTESESQQVARQFITIRAINPKIGEGACLADAQLVLPENRRRKKLSGFSQTPRIKEIVFELMMSAERPQSAPEATPAVVPPPDIGWIFGSVPTDKLIELLKARDPSLFQPPPPPPVLTVAPSDDEMEASLAKRRPELFLSSAPLPKLVESFLSKTLRVLTTELKEATAEASAGVRTVDTAAIDKLNKQIAADREILNKQLAEDRKSITDQMAKSQKATTDQMVKVEERLYTMQQQINGLVGYVGKPQTVVVAPAPQDPNAYMPMFLLAGGDRADFQRLQSQMVNAGVRLQKIDVSNPRHISIPTHDRVIVWTAKLANDLQSNVQGKTNPTKLMLFGGTFDELGPAILAETQKIRKSR